MQHFDVKVDRSGYSSFLEYEVKGFLFYFFFLFQQTPRCIQTTAYLMGSQMPSVRITYFVFRIQLLMSLCDGHYRNFQECNNKVVFSRGILPCISSQCILVFYSQQCLRSLEKSSNLGGVLKDLEFHFSLKSPYISLYVLEKSRNFLQLRRGFRGGEMGEFSPPFF